MKDKCVRCGRETEYVISIPIIAHLYFIEGSGQLCSECYRKLYMREKKIMSFQFQGEQICSRCGHKYEWVTTLHDKDEVVVGIMDRMWHNVKNCTQINQTNRYCIEVGCPECGKREFIEKNR